MADPTKPPTNAQVVAVTLDVAAARYSLTVRQLRAMIARGALPAIRPPGSRAYVVRVEDLDRVFAPVVAPPKAKRRETPREREVRQLREAGIAV